MTVLQRRFGLDGEDELTLAELGVELGVTREAIRQIQNRALSKVRRWIQCSDAMARFNRTNVRP